MNTVASTEAEPAHAWPPSTSTCPVDLKHPSVARVYDYLLGGSLHWAVDRAFGRRVNDQVPQFQHMVRAHRQFVRRVVRHLVGLGVRQFVDIGAGLLSTDNTHQIADEFAPDSRVVYVDNEPVVVAHTEMLLDEVGDPDRHAVINTDLCDPDDVWDSVQATGLVDPAEPIAVFLFWVLHMFKPAPDGNDRGAQLVRRYRELLPVGSYLGVSHITAEGVPPALEDKLRELKQLCDTWWSHKVYSRSHGAVRAFLGDFDILQPGLVWTPQWHPEDGECLVYAGAPSESAVVGGVGQKPAAPRSRRPSMDLR